MPFIYGYCEKRRATQVSCCSSRISTIVIRDRDCQWGSEFFTTLVKLSNSTSSYTSSVHFARCCALAWRKRVLLSFGEPSNERGVSDLQLLEPTGNDEALLLRLLQYGDRDALEVLYDRYAPLVRSIGRRILGDATKTEDFVHDLFLFLLKKSECFDPAKGSVRVWLTTMTRHLAQDRRKYLASRGFYSTGSSEESPADIPETINSDSAERRGGIALAVILQAAL
jgi:hypothetical protein